MLQKKTLDCHQFAMQPTWDDMNKLRLHLIWCPLPPPDNLVFILYHVNPYIITCLLAYNRFAPCITRPAYTQPILNLFGHISDPVSTHCVTRKSFYWLTSQWRHKRPCRIHRPNDVVARIDSFHFPVACKLSWSKDLTSARRQCFW